MKVRIEIDTKTFIRFWLVMLGFVVAAIAVYSARTALILVGSGFFLALALDHPVTRLAKHMPGNSRVVSTAISFLLVVAFIGSFLFVALPPIIGQTAKLIDAVPTFVDSARSQWSGINNVIDKYNLQPQVDQAIESINSSASKWAGAVGSNVITGVGSVFVFVANMFLILVIAFFMLVEKPIWTKRLWSVYQNKEKRELHKTLATQMHGVVSSYVNGQLTVSAIGAFFAGLAVFILSFIFPISAGLALPVAAITFILSLIPMFGATIAGALVTLLLVISSVAGGIVYVIYFIIYQQIENNYISPKIQSRGIDLSPLAILVAVTIGLYMFGIAGGIISIPIAGCIKVLIDAYLKNVDIKHTKDVTKDGDDALHKKALKKLIAKN